MAKAASRIVEVNNGLIGPGEPRKRNVRIRKISDYPNSSKAHLDKAKKRPLSKVLVAYGTKYGATVGIAEKIGQVLVEQGLEAELLPAESAGDPSGYDAVVVGSGVYFGKWRKPAVKFLEKNEEALVRLPVWLFSSGPTGEGDPVELTKGWESPKAIQGLIEKIKPRDVALFHGMLDIEKLGSVEKMAIKKVEAPIGDFRDWQAISEWAAGIATALKE